MSKLIKRTNGRYDLYYSDDINQLNTIASSFDNPKDKLSIKNCEAIENGYDLDELAKDYANGKSSSDVFKDAHKRDFKEGFQKALEILGDKKFTEDDIRKTIFIVSNPLDTRYSSSELISSLQQTEWDVEIVMETPAATYGHSGWHKQPMLDKDGCLILKRK